MDYINDFNSWEEGERARRESAATVAEQHEDFKKWLRTSIAAPAVERLVEELKANGADASLSIRHGGSDGGTGNRKVYDLHLEVKATDKNRAPIMTAAISAGYGNRDIDIKAHEKFPNNSGPFFEEKVETVEKDEARTIEEVTAALERAVKKFAANVKAKAKTGY